MKFFLPLALLAIGVSAQSTTTASNGDSDCSADYIVSRCLETENPKALACTGNDYQCLCDAYNAISTCFNNCPNDTRAAPAKNQADTNCRQASLLNTATTSAKPKSTSATATVEATTTTTTEDAKATSSSASESKETGAAADLAANAGTLLFGVAGVVAAML